MTKLCLLDRDGVVNEVLVSEGGRGPRNLSEFRFAPGFLELTMFLRESGITSAVLTNQPDLARGFLMIEDEEQIANLVLNELPPQSLYLRCPHDSRVACSCRKPKPGLIFQALKHFNRSPHDALFVGDRWTDMLAAQNAGVMSVLVRHPWSWDATSQGHPPEALRADVELDSVADLQEVLGPWLTS